MPEFHDLPRGLPGSPASSGSAPRALWMDPKILADSAFWQEAPDKVRLGALGDQLLAIKDNRHLMTIAGSRAGKGTSVIVPVLLTYTGSICVLDPKGENATLTCRRRGQGEGLPAGGLQQDVHVLDPFRVAEVPDHYRSSFNPFAGLDAQSSTFVDDCDSIADALVVASAREAQDHWNNSARMVLRGFIAWVAAHDQDLRELQRLLHLPPETEDGQDFYSVLEAMHEAPRVAAGVPAQTAAALQGMSDKERDSVLSTVRQNIAFLGSPPMAELLSGRGRSPDLHNWKRGACTVYLCLPAGRLHRHARFFRLFITRLLAAVESDPRETDPPALLLLDEMAVLGHMEALETGAGLLAGFGVRIWSVLQDLNQLKHLYRDRWETFMGNSGILQFFGVNDQTTLKYVSDRLGQSSMLSLSQSEISYDQAARGFSGKSTTIQTTPLLTPNEVGWAFSRQSGKQLILYPGADPIFLDRVPYWTKPYAGMVPQ